jgi:hypothetical protein
VRKIIQLVFVSCLVLFSRTETNACSCAIPEIPQAVESAKAVFVGFVTDIIEPRTNDPKAPWADRLYLVKFKVGTSWKGNVAREITILSDQGRAGCYSWGSFVKGGSYLVYAEPRVPGAPRKTLAVLFVCNRTTLLSKASQDVKQLESAYLRHFHF